MKTRCLEEVKKEVGSFQDRLGKSIEPKIEDLVIGLRRWGIATKASCEGHKERGCSYPWVDVPAKEAVRLSKLVSWQNRPKLPGGKDNLNIWVLRPGADIRLIPANRERPLEKMQEDAVEFGLFLQNLSDDWAK